MTSQLPAQTHAIANQPAHTDDPITAKTAPNRPIPPNSKERK